MKINFRNKAAKLQSDNYLDLTCKKCPFCTYPPLCPFETSSETINCGNAGYWVDGESLDIFKI